MKRVILILILILAMISVSGCTDSGTDSNGDQTIAYVVLSDSMEPAIYRGDMAIVDNNPDDIQLGDIVIYNATWHSRPIIHRVISIQEDSNGNTVYELKGDKNSVSDPEIVYKSQILSKVVFIIPKAGYLVSNEL